MRLIATDLDGTLLNEEHEVSKENIKAIQRAQEQGIEVIVATGRTYFDAVSICKKFGLNTYLISYNGAAIHDKIGQEISSLTMGRDDVRYMVNWLEERDYYYEVSTNKKIYISSHAKEILQREAQRLKGTAFEVDSIYFEEIVEQIFSQSGMTPVKNYEEAMDAEEALYKVFCFSFDDKKRKIAIDNFAGMKQFLMTSSMTNNFELGNKDASKGNALKIVADRLGISLDKAMAIGDNYNDVSMMEIVGFSVAMGTAKEDIKKLCSFVTYGNDKHGVAHAIEKFMSI
ncbi:Cof-type HAD-IIB family hydrolase [Pelosinus fermentans]|uniref:Cof-like hydrolase n=1 Tax=Pelosinus fermentans JBW45 TaxID=1192197 RepID=I8TTR4_9FIRM|nr:Cof-type HAD-IIB family hydrolase [Pelosinus fermentans]AJQ28291.1 Cof-like hydrolase [Pelosinus fermentans JBW45]